MSRIVLFLILLGCIMSSRAVATQSRDGGATDLRAAAEFLAGNTLSPAEQQQLATDTSDQPAASELMQKVRHADSVTHAELRTKVLIALYFHDPAPGGGSLTDIVWTHDPVLAADAHSGLIVTRQALDDMIASNDFVAALAGQPPTSADERQAAQQLAQQYAGLPSKQQQMLAFASQRWQALTQRWQQMTEAARARITQELHQTATSPQTVAVAARTLEQVALEHHDSASLAAHGSAAGLGHAMGAWFGMHTFLRGGGL
jgi:hypothetical protein